MGTSAATNDPAGAERDIAAATRGLFNKDGVYVALLAAQTVLAAAFTPITTRLLGPTQFGASATGAAVMQLVVELALVALMTGVQWSYHAEDDADAARKLVACGLVLSLLIGGAIFFAGRWWAPAIGLGPFPASIQYSVLWAITTAMTLPALALLRSRNQMRAFLIASLAMSIGSEILSVTMVLLIHRTATIYLLGQFLGQAATAAMVIYAVRPKLPRWADTRMMRERLGFSVLLWPVAIATLVSSSGDRLVIRRDLGPTYVAHYGVAVNVGGFAVTLLWMVQLAWLPRILSTEDPEARRKLLGIARDGLHKLVVPAALAIALASPLILWIWAPASFSPSRLLLVTALITACAAPAADANIYSQALIASGRARPATVVAVTCAVINIGLNVLLVPHWGINGSAGISLGCTVLSAALMRRAAGSDGPVPSYRQATLAAVGIGACIASSAIPPSGLWLAARLAVSLVMIVISLLSLRRLARGR